VREQTRRKAEEKKYAAGIFSKYQRLGPSNIPNEKTKCTIAKMSCCPPGWIAQMM
jgi:hypothetical protein